MPLGVASERGDPSASFALPTPARRPDLVPPRYGRMLRWTFTLYRASVGDSLIALPLVAADEVTSIEKFQPVLGPFLQAGPIVRIRLPPAERLRTIGSSAKAAREFGRAAKPVSGTPLKFTVLIILTNVDEGARIWIRVLEN